MAKKVILKDLDNIEMMPVTRGELIVDSLGNPAFSSNLFLATQSLPGLMSGEDKTKLDSLDQINGDDKKVELVNTTTNDSYRLLFSSSADDETKTEGARKSAKLLFNPSTGALTATTLIGKLDWSNLNNIPEEFTPTQHIHNTSEITALTNYSKASSASDLVITDTLNIALGKLEYKADTAYDWIISVTTADTDKYINKWQEILDFLNAIDNTEGADITDEFVTRKTGQTITGEKIFSGTSSELLTIDRNSESPALVRFAKNGTVLGYIGIDNTKKPVVSIDGTVHYVLHSGNSHITNGVITINNQTITPITSHQSLANYVNLNGKQDITGEKTFKATINAYNINPVTNNTYSLGTSSLAWKNIYAINGNFSSTVSASGFLKANSSDDKVLLGGGGDKAISDFVLKTDEPITEISKNLTVTSDWMDTGISASNIPGNGTYIVQVFVNAPDAVGYMYSMYFSGIMSWYKNSTNDDESDEIILHRAGTGYGKTIYLRTKMSIASAGTNLRLLIAASENISAAYTYTFKFKKVL